MIKKKFILERGITLDKVDEMLLNFYHRLENSSWTIFTPKPCKENDEWVKELYVNLMKTDIKTRLITIQGKVVNYGPKSINVIYRLLDHDIEVFADKDCEFGAWIT